MAAQRRHRSRRRRRGRFGGLYRFFAGVAVIAAVAVACVIFFRVNSVTVLGNARYTAQEIVEASGIKAGDNLVALSKGKIASVIRTRLPYVESVAIRRRLPDSVEITVRERVAVASVDSSDGRWLISSQGKLLEKDDGRRVVSVVGLTAQAAYAGSTMEVPAEQKNTLDHVLSLLAALEEQDMLEKCGTLDCTPTSYMTLTWDIYTLKFPRGGDYPYMLRLVQMALSNEKMPQNEPGTFDLTVEDNAVHFKRER